MELKKPRSSRIQRPLEQQDIIKHVLRYIDLRSIFRLASTAKIWNQVTQDLCFHPQRISLSIIFNPFGTRYKLGEVCILYEMIHISRLKTLAAITESVIYNFRNENPTQKILCIEHFTSVASVRISWPIHVFYAEFLRHCIKQRCCLHLDSPDESVVQSALTHGIDFSHVFALDINWDKPAVVKRHFGHVKILWVPDDLRGVRILRELDHIDTLVVCVDQIFFTSTRPQDFDDLLVPHVKNFILVDQCDNLQGSLTFDSAKLLLQRLVSNTIYSKTNTHDWVPSGFPCKIVAPGRRSIFNFLDENFA